MSRARNVADIMSGAGSNVVFEDGFGLDFGAVAGGGATGSVLDDYEEGTWTPTGNNISFASVTSARYIKIGSQVTVQAFVFFPTTSDGNVLYLNDLPFAVVNATDAFYPGSLFTNSGRDDYVMASPNTSRIEVRNGSNGNKTLNNAYSGDLLIVNVTYETS